MFPRNVFISSDGKSVASFLVQDELERDQAFKDGWSFTHQEALDAFNKPEPVAPPKKRGRPAKVVK